MDRRDAARVPRAGDLPRARASDSGSGRRSSAGFSLGNVTATLLAAVAIGQLGIAVPGPIKSTFFLLFLFAVATAWGRSSSAGSSKDGPEADPLLGDRAGAVPAGADRLREARRARPRVRGRPVRGLADDLGVDRRRHRTRSTASGCPPSRPRPTSTRSRSATPSPTSSAPSAPRSCWRRSARS